jgi:hypothetical protein
MYAFVQARRLAGRKEFGIWYWELGGSRLSKLNELIGFVVRCMPSFR